MIAMKEVVEQMWQEIRTEKGIDESVVITGHDIKCHGSTYSGPVYLSDGSEFYFEAKLPTN